MKEQAPVRAERKPLTDSQREGKKATYRKWYDNNKTSFNAQRRARYQEDPDEQERARERARVFRKKKKGTDYHVCNTRMLLIKGKNVVVSSLGTVAQNIGVTPSCITRWERVFGLPRPTAGGSRHRYYTPLQEGLVRQYKESIPTDRAEVLQRVITDWNKG